jgi:endoglycosylceramidase
MMRFVSAAVLVATVAAATSAQAAGSTKTASHSRYSHAGRWITDKSGRAVVLHGFNLVIKAPPYSPSAVGFDDDDAHFLAEQGFNVVRLGIIWKALEPQPGVYDDAYLNEIRRTFDTLRKRGIAVLLDFHQDMYNERYQGEGAPDWAIVGPAASEGPGTQAGFPANYVLNHPLNHAFDAFWNNPQVPGTGKGVQDFFAQAWAHVAKRFAGRPGLLGYNLFNEPWPGTAVRDCLLAGGLTSPDACGIPEFEATKLTAFSERVSRAIRRVDPRTMLWPAPAVTFDYGTRTGLGRIDDNAGLAYNAYCATAQGVDFIFKYQTGKPCAQQAAETHDNALAYSQRTGGTLLNTEFGASDETQQWIDYLDAADERFISWMYWTYWNYPQEQGPDTQSLLSDISQGPGSVKRDKLRVLARPFASFVAGTPLESNFSESTLTLTFTYSPEAVSGKGAFPAGSITELNIPAVQYPNGYSVQVEGAHVVSGQGADVLRLRSCGTGDVEVTVTPGKIGPSAGKC